MLNLTITAVHGMLRINRHRLDEELELQGEIAAHVSREVAKANSKMLEAFDKLKRIEGELTLEYRDAQRGEKDKDTVPEIAAKVLTHRDRVAAFQVMQSARYQHEEWDGLLQAWKQRSYSLTALASLHSTNYFAQRSTTVTGSADETVDRARAAIRMASDVARPTRTRVRAE